MGLFYSMAGQWGIVFKNNFLSFFRERRVISTFAMPYTKANALCSIPPLLKFRLILARGVIVIRLFHLTQINLRLF